MRLHAACVNACGVRGCISVHVCFCSVQPGDKEVLYRQLLRHAAQPVDAVRFYVSLIRSEEERSEREKERSQAFLSPSHSSPAGESPGDSTEFVSKDASMSDAGQISGLAHPAGHEERGRKGEGEEEQEGRGENKTTDSFSSSSFPSSSIRIPLSFLKAACAKALEQSTPEASRGLLDLLPFLLSVREREKERKGHRVTCLY